MEDDNIDDVGMDIDPDDVPDDDTALAGSAAPLTVQAPTGTGLASRVLFGQVCELLDKVASMQGEGSSKKKQEKLSQFIASWRKDTKESFYPVMRLLLPQLDTERRAYGLKETQLAKTYLRVFSIPAQSESGQKLLHWDKPGQNKSCAGDFPTVAFEALHDYCPRQCTLTVEQVNFHLDQVCLAFTRHRGTAAKKDLRMTHLEALARSATAVEQKWLTGIILKKMRSGFSEKAVLSAFHPNANERYSTCSSIRVVCEELNDPNKRLDDNPLELFVSFKPMLGLKCSNIKLADVVKKAKDKDTGTFFIEIKIDGDRTQLHKNGTTYKYFSRSGLDFTPEIYGGSLEDGHGPAFTRSIHSLFHPSVKSCILDGEMVGFDPALNTWVPKGVDDVKTYARAFTDQKDENAKRPCFVVFDLLFLNGEDLTQRPLKERLDLMKTVFKHKPGYMEYSEVKAATSKEEIIAYLNEAIDNRQEGLVIKSPTSTYKPDERTKSGWFKLKPEYVDKVHQDLDLLIIGGYWAKGKLRGSLLSHFLLGVSVPPLDPDEKPSVFWSFCKVGSGYTLKELRALNEKLSKYWKVFDKDKPPSSVILADGFKEMPNVYIEPENSVVVQIKAGEFTTVLGNKFKTGYTLRFPRLMHIRDDKPWYQCLSVTEVQALKDDNTGSLAMNKVNSDAETFKKRKTVTKRRAVAPAVPESLLALDMSSVPVIKDLFKGSTFYICNWGDAGNPSSLTKEQGERLIKQFGGSVVMNQVKDVTYVLAHKFNVRTANVIKRGEHCIMNLRWLAECCASGTILPLAPKFLLHATAKAKEKFLGLFDKFGDNYREMSTVEGIMDICRQMDNPVSGPSGRMNSNPVDYKHGDISASEMASLDAELEAMGNDPMPRALFRDCVFYFDRYMVVNDETTRIPITKLDVTELYARAYGATVLEQYVGGLTSHIIMDTEDTSRYPEFKRQSDSVLKATHIVSSEWVHESIDARDRQHVFKFPVYEDKRPGLNVDDVSGDGFWEDD